MRKSRIILVATLAVLGAVFAFARLALGPASGTVLYLQNKATGQFVTSSATVDALGAAFQIKNEGDQDGKFGSDDGTIYDEGHIYTYVRFQYAPNTGSYLKMGSASVTTGSGYHKWAAEERAEGWVIRCIYTPTQGNGALPYAIQGAYLAVVDGKLVITEELSDVCYWNFVSEDDYAKIKEEVEKALAEEEAKRAAELKAAKAALMPGADATFVLTNPNFSGSTEGWKVNDGKIELKGSADNNVITAYNYKFDVSQTITDLRPGVYKVQAQAFSRPTTNQGSLDLVASGAELENNCVLYANDVEVTVKQLTDEHLDAAGAGTWSEHTVGDATIYLPNNGSAFSDAFTRGMYDNELTVEVGEDGVLTIGVKNTVAPSAQGECYCGYDNFRLTFVDFTKAAKDDYAAVAAKAKSLLHVEDPMNNDVKAALEAAYATYGKNYADVPTAAKNLRDAVDDAVASIVAYKGIDACYKSNKSFLDAEQAAALDANADVQAILQGLEDGTIAGDGMDEMETIIRACEEAKVPFYAEELDVVEVSTQCEYTDNYKPGGDHGITINWEAIAESLAVSTDDLKIYAVMPDGTLDESYERGSKGTDGWRDAEGNWATWNSQDNMFYVQFNGLNLVGVGSMRTSEPISFTAEFKIVDANKVDGDWVTLKVTHNVVEPEAPPTIADLNSTTDVAQNLDFEIGVENFSYGAAVNVDVDLNAILTALGATSLDDLKIYAVQSDGTLDKDYKLGPTDGWRAANGDWAGWGDATSQFYVKADFSRESGQLYEIGAHPDHSGAHLTEAVTYTAKYAFVNANNDAVILNVNLVVDYSKVELAEGKYYLVNVESERYWGAGNNWGTQASLLEHPDYVTLIPNEDGTYKMESQVSNGGTQYYFNGSFMDNGSPVNLVIKNSGYLIGYLDDEETEPVYGVTIANAADGKYYGYDGNSTVLAAGVEGDGAYWFIASEDEMHASLLNATVYDPVDATFLITDHTFGRNHRYVSAWTNEGGAALTGGNSNKHDAEKYHGTYNVYQTLTVPAGVYTFDAQGFYRQDGTDNENLPVFYANDVTTLIPLRTGTENSMADACNAFEAGKYKAETIIVNVEDEGEGTGTLTVGTRLENNTTLWCIWDNFVLHYYGADATIDEVAAQANVDAYLAALDAAEAIDQEAEMAPAVLAALQTAISRYNSVLDSDYTAESLAQATEALKAATDAANLSMKNAEAIAAMKALTENTNVYTAEAFDKFQQYFNAYEDGTLEEVLVNPDVVQGWHAANQFDDLLLSAWTIGGNQCADFNTSLYINTWSVEGDNDGTGFHVPFFEYWTGDDNSLGANTLEATVTDLEAGDYEVTAWVRVRAKNGVDATETTGITLQVNDGEAVDVTEGEKVGDSQFNIGEYTAVGTVGEDGVLKIKFVVAEDNNISWLSYKNVYYTKVGGEEPEVANMRYEDLTAEDFFTWTAADATGEKVQNAGCAYVLNESTGMPYGDGNVHYLNYADLSDAVELVIVATEGTPRTLFNRVTDGGAVGVEEPRDGDAYWTVVDNGDGSKTYTVDIEKIVAEYGFAHLHSIKEANWQSTTVLSMKVGYSLDAPEKKVPEGWKTLIANGNFAGEDASNFYTKGTGYNDPVVATIEAGIGVDGGHAVKVEAAAGAAQNYTYQFFIKGNENLPAGKKIHVEFDYRADVAAGSETQWHSTPGTYLHYAAIGSPNFTTEWQHYEYDGEVPSQADGSASIAFNISVYKDTENTYYFDNIVFWVEDPKAVEIDNFDKLMIAQVAEANVVVPVGSDYVAKQEVDVDFTSILKTLGIESITDAKVYAVQSDGSLVDNLGAKNTDGGGGTDGWRNADGDFAGWGDETSQFYVKADFSAESGQLWEIGGHPLHSGAHLTEATTYTAKYAFVVGETSIDNTAAVLNVNVIYDNGEDAPEAEVPAGWRSIITNGNLAGDDVSSFYTKGIGYNDPVVATIYDGAGVNGSRGLKIEEGAKEPDDWTTQFFINGSEALPAGTKIHVEFDYRATSAAQSGTQFHTAPGTYKHYAAIGNQDFTTEWKHFTYEGTVESGADGSAAIAFNLSINKDPKTYYFDNIVFWVEDESAGVKDATAINGVNAAQQVEGIYNAQGQKLDQMQRGLNIVNGKKVLIK